jgi:hypothetical protein
MRCIIKFILQNFDGVSTEYIVTCPTIPGCESIKLAAKSRREATKLYGLLLHHHGFLKNLGGSPCCVAVKQAGNSNDTTGQCFKLWNAGEKIYAECFLPPKRVSMFLF